MVRVLKISTLVEKAYDTHRGLDLLVSGDSLVRSGVVLSPFFQLKHCPNTDVYLEERTLHKQTSRDIRISEPMKVIYVNFSNFDPSVPKLDVQSVYDDGSSVTFNNQTVSLVGCHTHESIRVAIAAVIIANAPSTITEADIQFPPLSPSVAALRNAPQAAIADCPADAVTNYNVLTTLLGAVTGAVNTANTKQNQIATQLNSLFAELRALGLIST